MARPRTKVTLAADGLALVFGAVASVMADPWLAAIAMGIGGAIMSLGCWARFRHPYVVIHEIMREGSRTRYRRNGVDRHSPQKRPRRGSSNPDIIRRSVQNRPVIRESAGFPCYYRRGQ